jgi:Zn-dependent protease with chaperone function
MNVSMHVLLLTGYATTVASCAPRLLSDSSLPRRSPTLAMALWHTSIGSAGLAISLAAVKLMSTARLLPVGPPQPDGRTVPIAEASATMAAGLLIVVYACFRLLLATTRLLRARRNARRRHLDLLAILGRHDPELEATVVPSTTAAAYCVPRTNQVVITEHALRLLEPQQLAAVLAHERAHLTGRHHLLVTWATLLVDAFPGVAVLDRLREATSDLVELLADDKALRQVDGSSLAGAIALLSRGAPEGGLAATGGQALVRVERLLDPPPRLWPPYLIGGAVVMSLLVCLPLFLASYPAAVLF